MIDSTPITTEIARLIAAGTHESKLLFSVARKFPDLTSAELSAALLEATAASRRHGDIDGHDLGEGRHPSDAALWPLCRRQARTGAGRDHRCDVFRIEVPGKAGLHLNRMEHLPGEGYYSVKGYSLHSGLRTAIGDKD
jgi:hypothetical protein